MKLGKEYVIYETKKQRVLDAHIWQLKYYIYQLSKIVKAPVKGILVAPKFRKILTISNEDIKFIDKKLEEIMNLKSLPDPPIPVKNVYCKKCAYRTFCWSDKYE
jgi:CRISPR-associated exonuclease Cas4